jgi:hypothetical protein
MTSTNVGAIHNIGHYIGVGLISVGCMASTSRYRWLRSLRPPPPPRGHLATSPISAECDLRRPGDNHHSKWMRS